MRSAPPSAPAPQHHGRYPALQQIGRPVVCLRRRGGTRCVLWLRLSSAPPSPLFCRRWHWPLMSALDSLRVASPRARPVPAPTAVRKAIRFSAFAIAAATQAFRASTAIRPGHVSTRTSEFASITATPNSDTTGLSHSEQSGNYFTAETAATGMPPLAR